MKYPISYSQLRDDLEYYTEVVALHNEATEYLTGFKWCKKILNTNLYLNLGAVLCVFVFEIENAASSSDNYLWVIVGDLPAMYLDIHGPKTIKEALKYYISLASGWIYKVKAGKPLDDCYPFKAIQTTEIANIFQNKISFLRNNVMPELEEIALSL